MNDMRVMVKRVQYRDTWRVYCPTLGEDIGRGFESEDMARKAAESFGYRVVNDNDFRDVEHLEINGADYTSLLWWLDNADVPAVRMAFAELLLYEAGIDKAKRDGDEHSECIYTSMSVATSIVLEYVARDFGRWFPSYRWTTLARYKNDEARKGGAERVTTTNGSIEL